MLPAHHYARSVRAAHIPRSRTTRAWLTLASSVSSLRDMCLSRTAASCVLHMFAQQHIPLSPRHAHGWGKRSGERHAPPSELTEDANQGNARVVRERGAHDGSATFSLGKSYLRSLRALVTTRRELAAMQAAPTSGRMVRPKAESAPAAKGMVMRLKISAQKRFCLIIVSVRLERS